MKLVTFDAAHTLLRSSWSPGAMAVECGRSIGLEIPDVAADTYVSLMRRRWPSYLEDNLSNDDARCDRFWDQLAADWLSEQGHSSQFAAPLMAAAREQLYGSQMSVFGLYEDVDAALAVVASRGLKAAVISNWDYSLHRILRRVGIFDRFDFVAASLQIGPEKPDPALFHWVLERMEVAPQETLHIGDDPIDDVQGARDSGMMALHLDRGGESLRPLRIASLRELDEALDWFA